MRIPESAMFAMHMGDLALRKFFNADEVEWTFASATLRALPGGLYEVQFAGSRLHVPGETKVSSGSIAVRLSRHAVHGWLAESVTIMIARGGAPGADDLLIAYTCDPSKEHAPTFIGLLPARASRIAG